MYIYIYIYIERERERERAREIAAPPARSGGPPRHRPGAPERSRGPDGGGIILHYVMLTILQCIISCYITVYRLTLYNIR